MVPEASHLYGSAQDNVKRAGILTNTADDALLAEALELGRHGGRGDITLEAD